MSDTKTLATILIFVVCSLYVLALLIIGIRFMLQYVKFLRGHTGEVSWRQSPAGSPRNSFLHELQISRAIARGDRRYARAARGRANVIVEPPPSYAYAIEEEPPSYEDFEKYYSKSACSSACSSKANSPCDSDSGISINTVAATVAVSVSVGVGDNTNTTVKSQKYVQEECPPPPPSFSISMGNGSSSPSTNIDTLPLTHTDTDMNMNSIVTSRVDTSLHL